MTKPKPTDPFAPIASELKTPSPCTLTLTKKALSLFKQETIVKNDNDKLFFKIASSLFSIGHHRVIQDHKGKPIGQFRRNNVPLTCQTFYIGTMDDETICSMKMKGLLDFTKCEADIYLGDDIIGEVVGMANSRYFTIKIKNTIVAKIQKKPLTSFFVEDETYRIYINEGVDSVFVVMIMIVFDELFNGSNRK